MSRVAVVTGASAGIGRALAKELAGEGYAVGLTARRKPLLETLREEIERDGGTAAVAVADAGDRDETLRALHALAETLGPVDLLVANAGVGLSSFIEEPDAAGYETMVRVNLLGPHYAVEAVLPSMLARGAGHIVAVSSLAAYVTAPGSGGYSATKAGLSSWMESIRIELRDKGIHCTTIQPGFVKTAMTDQNTTRMPLLMSAEKAAVLIARAIRKKKKVYDFPWRMRVAARLINRFPDWLKARLTRVLPEES